MTPTTEALLWPLGFLVALAIFCLIAAVVPGFREQLRWGRERDGARVTVRGATTIAAGVLLIAAALVAEHFRFLPPPVPALLVFGGVAVLALAMVMDHRGSP